MTNRDIVQMVGLAAIGGGAYLEWGWGAVLLIVGSIGFIFAIAADIINPVKPKQEKGSG